MKSPPCKNCETRSHGCHGRCEGYAAWKAGMKEAAENKVKQNRADNFRTANFMKAKSDWIRSHR